MSMMNANAAATTAMTANEPLDFELPEMGDSDFSNEELAEDMDGLTMSFPRIKIPAGGVLQFEIPNGDPQHPDYSPTLTGVILFSHASCVYWPEGDEYSDDVPPLCSSVDGKQGYGEPGGVCETCALSQFGSASNGRGKACKNMRVLYLLRSGEFMPLAINLSPTSISPFREFLNQGFAFRKLSSEMSLEHYKTPLLLTHSGGKDSCVLTELALRAEIPFEVLHAHTTADAPETVHFVRSEFARLENRGIRCSINYPLYKGRRTSMWDLIPRKLMPPTRVARYCCAVLKEQNGKGRFLATGVRWAESVSRSKRRGIFEKQVSNRDKEVHIRNDEESLDALFAPCKLAAKRFVNSIVDWSDREVWDFLHDARIPVNPLYFCGFSRVGCIGCPMAGKHRYFEFARYPQYEKLYLIAFDRMLEERRRRGKLDGSWHMGTTAEDVFHWWMEDDFIRGQMSLEEFLYVC